MPFLRRPAVAAAVVCAMVLVAAAPAGSTVVVPADLRDLVAAAQTVVYGRVLQTRTVAGPDRTFTVVTLGMTAFLKGAGGRTVEFQLAGGQVGRYRTVVVGAPAVDVGDEIVVFLAEVRGQLPAVVGFSQGFVRVVRSPAGDPPMVLAPPFSADGSAERIVRGGSGRRFVELAAFVGDIRALAARVPDAVDLRARPGSVREGR